METQSVKIVREVQPDDQLTEREAPKFLPDFFVWVCYINVELCLKDQFARVDIIQTQKAWFGFPVNNEAKNSTESGFSKLSLLILRNFGLK